jgi:hypothetical protein
MGKETHLSVVERKVLGALLLMSDNDMTVKAKMVEIAHMMGYKDVGGVLTYAIRSLDMKNYITTERGKYTVLL